MIPIAWNIKDSPFSRLQPLLFSSCVEIKISCKQRITFVLLFIGTLISDLWSDAGTKDSGTKKFETTNHILFHFSIKETWNSNSGKMVLWDTNPPSFNLLVFWIKTMQKLVAQTTCCLPLSLAPTPSLNFCYYVRSSKI